MLLKYLKKWRNFFRKYYKYIKRIYVLENKDFEIFFCLFRFGRGYFNDIF